jgi:hypothetical protein
LESQHIVSTQRWEFSAIEKEPPNLQAMVVFSKRLRALVSKMS